MKVELLSRFRSTKEQKEVVKRIEAGEVDMIIGTHRLLSKDVQFKDLGLVVVDEEQRFGVAHKERLKHLKKKVDVLTLSATPIPRTLNMSLSGMRDMSRDRNTAARPARDQYAGGAVLGKCHQVGHRIGTRAQRTGLFYSQSRRDDRNCRGARERLVPKRAS